MKTTSDQIFWRIAENSDYGSYFAIDLFLYLATRDASKWVNFRQLYFSVHIQSEVLKMASHLGCPNPLQNEEWVNLMERLPNELLLHIINILLVEYDIKDNLYLKTERFKILVETIRKISQRLYFNYFMYFPKLIFQYVFQILRRFQRIAADKTLWKGQVAVNSDWKSEDWKFMLDCLNNTTTSFHNFGQRGINMEEIVIIFEKASNLRHLATVLHIDQNSRMVLPSPWISLKRITLSCLRFGHIFQGVKLEETLPHIVTLIVSEKARENGEPSIFPDLSGCQHLILAVFFHGLFRFERMINSGEMLPLPSGLETLNLRGCRFHEEFMNHITINEMKKIIPSLKRFGPCTQP